MGTLQAHIVLSLLLKLQPPALGRLTTVDFSHLRFGGFSFAGAREPEGAPIPFITPADVSNTDIVIDLRTLAEAPVSPIASALRIGVEQVEGAQTQLPVEPRIVLCCRTGVRAWRAARALQTRGHGNLAVIAFGE
jgi:rhodanese-related sulfurtransferase